MPIWERAIAFVLSYEGSTYENDPNDSGGETKFGISKKSYPNEDIKNLTLERTQEIYRNDYWNQMLGEKLPEKLAVAVFDCAVNQGLIRSIRLLQAMLNVDVDGVMGPKTLQAAALITDKEVSLYLLERARLYMNTKGPNGVEHWGNNWGTRLIRLAKEFL